VQGDAFLPDGLRKRLGLADNEARLARDVYATLVLCAARPARHAFVTGRRAQSGDPLVPSRIAFQAPRDAIVARVRRFLPPPTRPESTDGGEDPAPALQVRLAPPTVESMSVTSFRTFLDSPYLFYLQRVLKLKTLDDRARELDPMVFGIFAHDVLETLGLPEIRGATAAGDLEAFLTDGMRRMARERFGAEPLPAVGLQLEQLEYRLRIAAREEAERRAQGWRILEAEWIPRGGSLEVDGEPMGLTGKVDRIDVHPDGRWAVLDYKTGEKAELPDRAAFKEARGKQAKEGGARRWRDLQLPLYRVLTEHLADVHGLRGEPELGYFLLGKDEGEIGVRIARRLGDLHEEALDVARDVVRRVRAGDWTDTGRGKIYDPIFEALLQRRLVRAGAADDEDEETDA
jgi:hypothetical protein